MIAGSAKVLSSKRVTTPKNPAAAPPGAPRCPQIIVVLRLVGVDQPALRVDQIDRAHVGAADAELTGVPPPAAVEQVAAESHRAVMAGRKHATALAQLAIEMPAL